MASSSSSSGAPKKAKNVALSPLERNGLASLDQKLALAKRCSHGIWFFFFFLIIKNVISQEKLSIQVGSRIFVHTSFLSGAHLLDGSDDGSYLGLSQNGMESSYAIEICHLSDIYL